MDLTANIVRIASRCGDCGRPFEDIPGDYCYMRLRPARLICLDCKLREAESNSTHVEAHHEK